MVCYAGHFLAPAEGFGLQQRLVLPLGPTKRAYCDVLAHFWCSVGTLVTFSSNLNNLKKNIYINIIKAKPIIIFSLKIQ